MKKIIIRANGTKRVYTENDLPSKTDQSQREECDVNHIIAKFSKTGNITHLARSAGMYADVSKVEDLLGSLMDIQRADDAFMTLPATVRKRFDNDPAKFIDFLQDPKNDEEAIQLGLKVSSLKSEKIVPHPKDADESKRKRASQLTKDDSNGEPS